MLSVKCNGELINNVIDFKLCRSHGLSEFNEKSDHTNYIGFFQGNYFDIDIYNDSIGINEYKESYKDVDIGEDFEKLIDFCENKNTIEALLNHKTCDYMAID